jgi:hypothetical protein
VAAEAAAMAADIAVLPPCTPASLDFHLRMVLQDVLGVALTNLMRHVAKLDTCKPSLSSPFDDPEDTSTTSTLMNLGSGGSTKRLQGRFHKHLGDWSLLAGSPGDAVRYYVRAAELLRSTGDRLWAAAAAEGELCAEWMIRRHDPVLELTLGLAEVEASPRLVEERYDEVVKVYCKRGAALLEVQARMRLAHFTLDTAEAAATSQRPNPYAFHPRQPPNYAPPLSTSSSTCSLTSLQSAHQHSSHAATLPPAIITPSPHPSPSKPVDDARRNAAAAAAAAASPPPGRSRQVMQRLGELLQSTATLPTLRDRAVAMMAIAQLYKRVGAHRKHNLVLYSLSQV